MIKQSVMKSERLVSRPSDADYERRCQGDDMADGDDEVPPNVHLTKDDINGDIPEWTIGPTRTSARHSLRCAVVC